jgi:Domain of unknown function (DUF4279)
MPCDKNVENTNATDEISVRLVITGFACDPHHITKLLDIHPDEVWRIGDELSFTSERKRSAIWSILTRMLLQYWR